LSSLQRFEGPALEALLDDVRRQAGQNATIVAANRLRRGGVAGFFAKERFEVVVDLDGEEQGEVELPEAAVPARTAPVLFDHDAELEPELDLELAAPAEPMSLLDLADRVSEDERTPRRTRPIVARRASTEAARRVSTETEPFNQVLDRIARDAGVSLAEPVAPAPAPVAPPVPAVDTVALARLGLPGHLLPYDAGAVDARTALLRALERLPRVEVLPKLGGSVLVVVGERDEAVELARDLAAEVGADPEQVILASTNYRGSAFVDDHRIAEVDEVLERRRAWRRRRRPTVVAVETSAAKRSAAWTSAVLEALEPTMTWASVEAGRKPEDLRAWADRVGGIDALSVIGTDATISPAAVLQTGIPVGRVDGRSATPTLWAALLTERLAA
jgi:hypothetical protein